MTVIDSNNRIELVFDDDKMLYVMTIYDKYGHYVDDVELDREDISALKEKLVNLA